MAYLTKFTKEELDDLKEGQKRMTNMLREFDRICRKYNLKYWCTGGTLIGTLRHKGWIPWDADMDVAMLDTDYAILQKCVQNELPKGMWLQDQTTDKYYKCKVGKIRDLYSNYKDYKCQDWHNGLQLDIFLYKNVSNILVPIQQINDVKKYAYDFIFELKELMFDDVTVYVPNNYETYSKNAWGGFKAKKFDKRKPKYK